MDSHTTTEGRHRIVSTMDKEIKEVAKREKGRVKETTQEEGEGRGRGKRVITAFFGGIG